MAKKYLGASIDIHAGGEEVRGCISAGEDDGFAAEGPDLGSADVEYIAEAGDIRQGHISRRARQAISEAGSVDEEITN